jgi:hypothetical protein
MSDPDKNVLKNCKSAFDNNDAWKKFYDDWHEVMYASSEAVYEEKWTTLQIKYEEDYWSAIDYLRHDLLTSWKTRIIKFYINKMLSFENTITSRAEDDHAKLKRALRSFAENLKKMINVIELLLKNERSEYLIAHEEAKTRLSRSCSVVALINLQIFISLFALRLIRKQLNKLTRTKNFSDEPLHACIKIYQTSMSLSCAHVIERRFDNEELLTLNDVHSHWRIYEIDKTRNRRAFEHDSESGQLNARENEDMRNKYMRNKDMRNEDMKNEDLRNKDLRNEDLRNKDLRNEDLRNEDAKNIYEKDSNERDLRMTSNDWNQSDVFSKISDDFMNDFSLDSFLVVHESKKMKIKERSFESSNKNKSIRRDSFDFEYAEAEFSQRVDEDADVERRENRDRDRERERRQIASRLSLMSVDELKSESGQISESKRARGRGRERERARRREREGREREREERGRERGRVDDVEEMSSDMTSLMQF